MIRQSSAAIVLFGEMAVKRRFEFCFRIKNTCLCRSEQTIFSRENKETVKTVGLLQTKLFKMPQVIPIFLGLTREMSKLW
jgi:hypothetical protein